MTSEEQNQKRENENTENIVRYSSPEPETVSVPGIVQCPQCNSTRIRKHSGTGFFLVTAAGFAVLLLLRNILVLLPLKNFMFILSFAVMFLICAACIYIWMRLFRNGLCKDCGHRFPIKLDNKQERDKISFPIRFSVLNGILLFLVGVTSPMVLEVLFNDKFVYFLIKLALVIFVCGFLVGLSILYQSVIFVILRSKIKRKVFWPVIFVLPVFLLGSHDLHYSLPRVRAERILAYGRLADLPESAADLKVYSWSSPFSGEWYLKFSAAPEDIDIFLDDSPSLEGQECKMYSLEKMKLPEPGEREKRIELLEAGHELYLPDSMAPDWYRPEIRVRGREYEVPPLAERRHDWGEVIVDDEENIVYIKIIWG